ncbi:MAG: hypothetical protein HEP71_08690 [Roseivirga sp.]|nr:hypothetical protein [Roseivirga sp.]
MTKVLTQSLLPFILLALAVITATWFIINSAAFAERPDLMAMASTIDLTLIIPLIYFLCIRKSSIPKITVLPVFILSMVLASQLIPNDYHQTLDYVKYLIPVVELSIISLILFNLYKTFKAYDHEKKEQKKRQGFLETVTESTVKAYGEGAFANAFATEISVFHYAIIGWNPQIEAPKGERFTYHKESGYFAFLGVILFALVAETAIFHLLLMQWSNTAAWILTALSIYSVFFVFGDFNAIRKRPMYFTEDGLMVRIGLRWRVFIPFSEIDSVELRIPDKDKEEFANFIVAGEANTVINLRSEVTAKGPYGFKKTFSTLALNMDDRQNFQQQLTQKIS